MKIRIWGGIIILPILGPAGIGSEYDALSEERPRLQELVPEEKLEIDILRRNASRRYFLAHVFPRELSNGHSDKIEIWLTETFSTKGSDPALVRIVGDLKPKVVKVFEAGLVMDFQHIPEEDSSLLFLRSVNLSAATRPSSILRISNGEIALLEQLFISPDDVMRAAFHRGMVSVAGGRGISADCFDREHSEGTLTLRKKALGEKDSLELSILIDEGALLPHEKGAVEIELSGLASVGDVRRRRIPGLNRVTLVWGFHLRDRLFLYLEEVAEDYLEDERRITIIGFTANPEDDVEFSFRLDPRKWISSPWKNSFLKEP